MGIYQFSPDDAYRFANEMGLRTRTVGDELEFNQCPYCKGGRSHGDKKTFSINLTKGTFNCLRETCGARGNMITLHKDFSFSLGRDADNYYDQSFNKYKKLPQKPIEIRDKAIAYLVSRGISEEIARRYEITARADHEEVIVFPFKDEHGIIQMAKYRNSEYVKGQTNGSKEWAEKDCKPILFGMYQCDPNKNDTLVLTEGQMDSLSVAEAGIDNAVSVPSGAKGFTWVPFCWDFLNKFKALVVFGDMEDGHMTLLDEMKRRFKGTVRAVREQDYQGCKDANEILQKYGVEAVRQAVWQAEAVPIPELLDIADIKKKNTADIPRLLSGIPSLDKLLRGGFLFGQVAVLTGERGEGKSTFASQLAAMAVNQNFPTMVYSGELEPWMFRDWFDYQVAGDYYINRRSTPYGETYDVNGEVYPDIVKWYTGKLKVFNNEVLRKDDHRELIEVIEDGIKQYGTKVVVIDNLMTAMNDDPKYDLNRQQTSFVAKLVEIAQVYEILIFLIAHPRKTTQGYNPRFDNDSVSGSSNITNLAGTVMRYGKPKGKDESEDTNDRIITVYKNRKDGFTNHKGIRVYYEESSKRISEDDKHFNLNLTWEKDREKGPEKGFISTTEEDMPF